MYIERTLIRIGLASLLALVATRAGAWESDWALDTEMAVLEAPPWRPIILPYGDGMRRGAPEWPIYRQQPFGAQGDFRQQPPGAAVPPPAGGTGGASGGSSSGGGSSSSGGSASGGGSSNGGSGGGAGSGGGGTEVADGGQDGANDGGQDDGNQGGNGPMIDPPDEGVVDIPTDPLPLPPPINAPF